MLVLIMFLFVWCLTKVAQALSSPPPEPFSSNQQYISSAGAEDESDEHIDEETLKQTKKKKPKSKTKKCRNKGKLKQAPVSASSHEVDLKEQTPVKTPVKAKKAIGNTPVKHEGIPKSSTSYVAGDFSTRRQKFIRALCSFGVTYKDANRQWQDSDARKQMLLGLSESELKRRRFKR